MTHIDIGNFEDLTGLSYSLIVTSDLKVPIDDLLGEAAHTPPAQCIVGDSVDDIVARLTDDHPHLSPYIALACSSRQDEVVHALNHATQGDNDYRFVDLSPALQGNAGFYLRQPASDYIVLFCINPIDQHPMWLSKFENWISHLGISVIYRHPLQRVEDKLLHSSKGILLWNGTLGCFDILKSKLREQSIPFSFMECGFFPQLQHIYFDKCGINVESSLATDTLDWLPSNYKDIVDNKRREFFGDVVPYSLHQDFIFVPLQMGFDSNIQKHSRFTQGMQSFVDYIENLYPNEVIVFKAHPRDPETYVSHSATSYWSKDNSLALVKGAKKVHGINSTVLFESILWGTPTTIEGDTLLSRHADDYDKILAAIILRQVDIQKGHFSAEAINRHSFLSLPE